MYTKRSGCNDAGGKLLSAIRGLRFLESSLRTTNAKCTETIEQRYIMNIDLDVSGNISDIRYQIWQHWYS